MTLKEENISAVDLTQTVSTAPTLNSSEASSAPIDSVKLTNSTDKVDLNNDTLNDSYDQGVEVAVEISGENFKIIHKKKYTLVILFNTMNPEQIPAFQEKMSILCEVPSNVIINCCCLKDICPEWVAFLTSLKNNLLAIEKKLVLVFLSPNVLEKINKLGVMDELDISPSLLMAIDNLLLEENTNISIGAKFLRAFVMSAVKTMFIQGKTFCKRKSIMAKKTDLNTLEGDLSGIINIESDLGPYAIFISFPESTFVKLLSRMLGENITTITDDIKDGATELLNIIYGQAKVVLNKEDAKLKPEIPALIIGRTFLGINDKRVTKIATDLEKGYTIIIPFISDLGEFFIRFWFKELSTAKSLIYNNSEV